MMNRGNAFISLVRMMKGGRGLGLGRGTEGLLVGTRGASPFFFFLQDKKQVNTGMLRRMMSTTNVDVIESGQAKIKNVAVIAHVDHGKTSLVDQLLRSSGFDVGSERLMDSMDLEKQRGITIISKNTSIEYKGTVINIVDTPGHADFGAEVENSLINVDGVLLVVAASEGVMSQTKFVLQKALSHNLKPILIINKADREESIPHLSTIGDDIFELLMNLGATDEQLDFPIIFASARQGWAVHSADKVLAIIEQNKLNALSSGEMYNSTVLDPTATMTSVLDTILKVVPNPKVVTNGDNKFVMLVTNIEYDAYLGRIVTGKVFSGSVKVGQRVRAVNQRGDNTVKEARVLRVYRRKGISKYDIDEGVTGDIISLAGVAANVTETIIDSSSDRTHPIVAREIDPPTLAMEFAPNKSPLKGKHGKKLTSSLIRERLDLEGENNATVKIQKHPHSTTNTAKVQQRTDGNYEVHARGEMQLGVLIETMRREDFEFSVSPPRVLFKEDPVDKSQLEPFETVEIRVPNEFSSLVINNMQGRSGALLAMDVDANSINSRMVFSVSSRNFMGFRPEMKYATSGHAIVNSSYDGHKPVVPVVSAAGKKGKMISMADGVATYFSLRDFEARGVLFIRPGANVYRGMVIGESTKKENMFVNPTKQKKLTNMRSAGSEEVVALKTPREMTLEETLTYIAGEDDFIIEVTPKVVNIMIDPAVSSKYL